MSLNLLDMSADNIVVGKYISNTGAVTSAGSNFYNKAYVPVTASGTYRLEASQSVAYMSIMEYSQNKTFIKRTLFGSSSTPVGTYVVHTVGDTTAFILIGSNIDGSTLSLNDIQAIDWMLSEGSEHHDFEPYGDTTAISKITIGSTTYNLKDARLPDFTSSTTDFLRSDGVWSTIDTTPTSITNAEIDAIVGS